MLRKVAIRTVGVVEKRSILHKPLQLKLHARLYSTPSIGAARFTKDHEWITVDTNNIGTVGITDHAQRALSDIVYVDLPDKGKKLKQKQVLGAVESVKAASDIYSPVSGEVVESNPSLKTDPSLINKDPQGSGWIAKLKLDAVAVKELDGLLDQASYKKHCEADHH